MKTFGSSWIPILLGTVFIIAILASMLFHPVKTQIESIGNEKKQWQAPDINLVPGTPEGDMIRDGRELIVNTSKYFGPHGIVAHLTNGMNCQNCHVEAGAKQFGNSFAAVASLYPKYRD